MKKIFIYIIISLLYCCKSENNETLNISTLNLPLNDSEIKAYDDSCFNFEYEIIQLEFNELSSSVDQSILSKIVFHNGLFVIGTKSSSLPRIFDKNGKFINTFLRGKAKNEIFAYRDFAINYQRNTIDIMDGLTYVKRYDMNGNYLETIDCSIDALEIASFNDKLILYDANMRSKDKYWVQFYDEKTKESSGFIEKFGMTKKVVLLPYNITSYKDRVFLYPYSNNIIYIIDNENSSPIPFLKINNVFSDRNISNLTTVEFIDVCKNKCYHGIFNFHIINDTYIYTRAGESIQKQIITDIKTNENYFHPLPMIANGYDEENEYFLLDLSIYESIKDKFSITTSKLKNDIEKLISENDGKEINPIIIKFKLTKKKS